MIPTRRDYLHSQGVLMIAMVGVLGIVVTSAGATATTDGNVVSTMAMSAVDSARVTSPTWTEAEHPSPWQVGPCILTATNSREFKLSANYPNPFMPSTRIPIPATPGLQAPYRVVAELIDDQGTIVARQVTDNTPAGPVQRHGDLSDAPAGFYQRRLIINDMFVMSEPFVLVK